MNTTKRIKLIEHTQSIASEIASIKSGANKQNELVDQANTLLESKVRAKLSKRELQGFISNPVNNKNLQR